MLPDVIKCDFYPKNALDYSIKSIGKAMHGLNLIKTTWDSDCQDGLDAMFVAMQCYKNNTPLDDIEKYNYVDVIVSKEIYEYLNSLP